MAKTYSGHETEIARLAGARMVVTSEVNEHDRFDEARVKQLTGGDTLAARFMRQDHFTFAPTHKLWLMGNHQPTVSAGGHSFWRRLRIVPFDHTVPEERRVEDLQGILAREHGPAVLAWIVAGARAYLAGGLDTPRTVLAATDEYENDQNTVTRFVEERCHVGGGSQVKIRMSALREAYETWCHAESVTPVTAKSLGMTLRSKFGVTDGKSNGHKLYVGIGLAATDETDPAFGRQDLA
jgi:putative DNA primase/helicase